MIWPFKKDAAEISIPEFKGIVFNDTNGDKWVYKPVKHITALEVAKLLPVFSASYALVDRVSYIKKENLERHFVINPEE